MIRPKYVLGRGPFHAAPAQCGHGPLHGLLAHPVALRRASAPPTEHAPPVAQFDQENPTTYRAPRKCRRGAVRRHALTVISPPLPVRDLRRISGPAGLCIAAGVVVNFPHAPVNPARSQARYALEAAISCPVVSRRRRRIPRQRRKRKNGPKPTCLCRGKDEIGGSRAGAPNSRRGKDPSSSVLILPVAWASRRVSLRSALSRNSYGIGRASP